MEEGGLSKVPRTKKQGCLGNGNKGTFFFRFLEGVEVFLFEKGGGWGGFNLFRGGGGGRRGRAAGAGGGLSSCVGGGGVWRFLVGGGVGGGGEGGWVRE